LDVWGHKNVGIDEVRANDFFWIWWAFFRVIRICGGNKNILAVLEIYHYFGNNIELLV